MRFKYNIFFVFCFFYSLSFAYINIYPLAFDQRIDGMGAIRDFTLTNTTKKTVKYIVNIEKGKDNDMSSWTEVYPKTLTLKPGTKGEIKLYVRSPKNMPLGEYSAVLNVKELEVPTEKKDRKKVNVFTNLKVNIYGYIGKLDSSISLKNIKVIQTKNNLKLSGLVKNESLRRVNLEVLLGDSKENKTVLITEFKLRKGEEIDLSTLKIVLDKDTQVGDITKLKYIYFYEKGVGKFLKREIIGS